MKSYDPTAIEQKWQDRWEQQQTNRFSATQLAAAKDPYYNLMMFPYPSAEGLHIGNIFAYTGADVQGRFRRLQGKTVFQPIGFDAFGIHSENFALKIGTNPNTLIPKNIENFTRQLKRIGGMFDWNHTVDTTDPDYYKWTQWIFLQLFNAGLVERRHAAVNWCPSCKTVLANEQVIQGNCERCDAPVGQRQLPQWFIKITKYSKRLLDNLPDLDWSETTKTAQVNWVGASEGALVRFQVAKSDQNIEVFTTRVDTIFGATYMVLAPEHSLTQSLVTEEQSEAVNTYLEQVAQKDIVERQIVDREKTGVFTGSYCINPANNQQIPVWVSDYVLAEYGTGAVMAVPSHDQRDFEFAKQFDLPVVRVIKEPGSNHFLEQESAYEGDGTLINSGEFNGLAVEAAKKSIVKHLNQQGLAELSISYRLHDWCISRQRYWGPPIPIIHCDSCGVVPVPEEDLPIELPYLEDFGPNDSGESPLARAADWCTTTCPQCGQEARRETDVSDTFLDSAWYFLRYPCSDNVTVAFDHSSMEKWLPVHSYIGGNEHAVLHLLYSRFLTMALYDLGFLSFEEPYEKFRAHGLLIKDGRKISKSRGNIIVPDELIAQYGADTVRMYLMFLGPFEQGGDYREDGIQGPFKFIGRLYQTVAEMQDGEVNSSIKSALHRTIKQVTDDMANLKFNTAIAAMMEYLNEVRAEGRTPLRGEVEPLITMIAPICPHVAEELFEQMGYRGSIFDNATWPEFDPSLLQVKQVSIPVSVNGKFRATIELPIDTSEEDAISQAKTHPNVNRFLGVDSPKRIIYVKDRMVNFVV